ncbi:hypothetical protein BTU51_1100 [Rickettsia rickettsii]|uniref:Uncharacterized protein n=1 Tax=Rickettsia rickettsii (strain Iowa) TaxID=452659 RepID=B0BUI2_RICRO|nr:hypothetical protein RrIowa_1100 [Rickettsia rickettsii str. Iowa]APU55842.1 hypothetical protein BTU50_1100 [Rickettsia rickettsii]APU57219.1 hypothetical protein BTU51_1100 [Rickettsia rickettsii]
MDIVQIYNVELLKVFLQSSPEQKEYFRKSLR